MSYKYENCPYSYDETCDGIFIELDDDPIYDYSVEVGGRDIFAVIDVDENGAPIRLEFLDFSKVIKKEIETICRGLLFDEVVLTPIVGDTIIEMCISIDGNKFKVKV